MNNYGTVEDVRRETGLLGDPSVSDDVIQNYLSQATGIVISYCSSIYNITNTKAGAISTDSPAFEYLKRCEALIASGYLLIRLYGGDIDGDKNGYEKIEEGKTLLKAIAGGDMRLIDENGKEYTKISDVEIPNKRYNVNSGKIGKTTPKFSVDDKY